MNIALLFSFITIFVALILLSLGVFSDTESGQYIYSIFLPIKSEIIFVGGFWFGIFNPQSHEKDYLGLYLVGWAIIIFVSILNTTIYGLLNANWEFVFLLYSNILFSLYIIFSFTVFFLIPPLIWRIIKEQKIILFARTDFIDYYIVGTATAILFPILLIGGGDNINQIITGSLSSHFNNVEKIWGISKILSHIILAAIILGVILRKSLINDKHKATILIAASFIISLMVWLSSNVNWEGVIINIMSGIIVVIIGDAILNKEKYRSKP